MKNNFKINKFFKVKKEKTILIAEISANHNNSIKRAKKLILEAKKSGADLIKIQSYSADSLAINCNKNDFKIAKNSPWKKYKNLWNLYDKAKTPYSWHKILFNYAKKIKIPIFSSPFDFEAFELLEKLKCPFYKIASPEINHYPLIEKIAKTKKPTVISLGLANDSEIRKILKIFKKYKSNKLVLLHCVSNYPAENKQQNLKTINYLKKYNYPVGLSDHSIGIEAALTTVALGGQMIEKHFNLKDTIKTPDSFFSSSKDEFIAMAKMIRNIETSLGKEKLSIKLDKKNIFRRRSIYISKKINKNEKISKDNIRIVRPSKSLSPSYYYKIIGKRVKKNFDPGDRIKISDLI